MKKFSEYQHVPGEPMTERDKKEIGSRFWNQGKWDNFVLPFLPNDCGGMTFVDMGSNLGLFLRLAEDKGFGRVIGVDSDPKAVGKAVSYRKRNGGSYQITYSKMEEALDGLPVMDYVVFANSHYYFLIGDWVRFLDKLRTKVRYCIIVTAKKRGQVSMAHSDIEGIKDHFKDWTQTGDVLEPSLEGDPYPRRLWGLCFKSPLVTRERIRDLDNGNHVQDEFYRELDDGTFFTETKYFKIIEKYRLEDRKDWTREQLMEFFEGKSKLYEQVRVHGLTTPIVVNSQNRVVDGNHRYQMMKHLGHEYIHVRRVL